MLSEKALPPTDINFIPLNKSQSYDGPGLMKLYKVRPDLIASLDWLADTLAISRRTNISPSSCTSLKTLLFSPSFTRAIEKFSVCLPL